MTYARILICDLIGLRLDASGTPDCSEVRAYIEARGGIFHDTDIGSAGELAPETLHFFYQPDLSTRDELIAAAGAGQYDAVIAAATFLPSETVFPLGGVRIGAGTGNMGSASWGGGSGEGGSAALMNTPGINSRATAQMAMKAVLKVRPDLPVDALHDLVAAGNFDTGKQLRDYPTEKLEGKVIAIIGYGNIGRELAKLARAFGVKVVIHARERHRQWIELEGFSYAASVVEAARGADVLSVHVGLGSLDSATGAYANAGLIGSAVLDALNDDAVVVNYDRGELIDIAALGHALASGKVAHAAIDADLFRNAETGALSGPMLPYLALVQAHGERLELLPHAAADTDHPSRVAGAKQAVDQLYEAIVNRRIVNLKGSLPPGYIDMGKRLPPGIGGVNEARLAEIAGMTGIAADLASSAASLAGVWNDILQAGSDEERRRRISAQGAGIVEDANRIMTLLQTLGLAGPYLD